MEHLYSTDRTGVEKDLISRFVKYNIHFTQLTKNKRENIAAIQNRFALSFYANY